MFSIPFGLILIAIGIASLVDIYVASEGLSFVGTFVFSIISLALVYLGGLLIYYWLEKNIAKPLRKMDKKIL